MLSRRRMMQAMAAAGAGLTLPRLARADWDDPEWAVVGPYRSPRWTDWQLDSFGADERVVATYFFYWFDFTDRNTGFKPRGDVYPYHPTDQATTSFLDPAWYVKQFRDMADAGIEIVLPDYWGEPGQYPYQVRPAPDMNYFATQGLPPMVEALTTLKQENIRLKVGLFMDTTIINNIDLTTLSGKKFFYITVRDFYSKIPPEHWAAIGNRPLVWLYDTQKVAAFDQSTFEYVYEQFPLDFGGLVPYIVREWQWYSSKNVPRIETLKSEAVYSWGAAPSGYNHDPRLTIAQVGPGFSNIHFGTTGANRIHTDRRGGAFYEEQLQAAVRSKKQIMAIETWNELGEASGILETVEFGRQYIDLTRNYGAQFKQIR